MIRPKGLKTRKKQAQKAEKKAYETDRKKTFNQQITTLTIKFFNLFSMKKLWRKVLAFALMGVLVGSVGCKDYDDDIDRIDGKLEELSGTVALKTDVQALQQTVNQLSSIDFSAFLRSADFEAKLQQSGVAYKSDLKEWLTGPEVKEMIEKYGYQTADDVKALIDGLQNADDVAATFDAMIKAYDLWGAVSGNVTEAIEAALKEADFMTGESALSASQVNQLLSTISAAFGAEGADVKAAIDGWLGQNFAKYMESYEPTDAFIAKLGIGDASIAAVLGELENANSDLVKAVKNLIVDATDGKVSEETLNTRFGEYDKKIEALSIRVAELEGRIQSLVWVPETSSEIQYNYIMLPQRVTLDLTKAGERKPKTIVLSESTKTLTWQVTPASVCKKIAEEHVSVEMKSVSTRAVEEHLQIAGVAIDPAEGTISVTISTDADLYAIGNENRENPAIALHVVVPGRQEEGENGAQYQGIDFLSNYTMVRTPRGAKLQARSFRFLKGEENFGFGNIGVAELDYTNKEPQLFLDGFAVAAPDKDEEGYAIYTDVAKLYEAFGEQGALKIVCEPELGADGKPVKATTNVDPKVAAKTLELTADGFTIKEADKALQYNYIQSGEYTCSIEGVKGGEYEGYGLELGTFSISYNLIPTTIEMTVPAVHYDWSYATASGNDWYTTNEMSVSGLTVERFNELKRAGYNMNLYKGDELVPGTIVRLTVESTPTAPTDVQYVKVQVKDNNKAFAEGGEFIIKGKYNLSDCIAKFEIPVTVTGAPELQGIKPAVKSYPFNGEYTYELISAKEGEDYIAQLWAANKEILKDQFKDTADSKAFDQFKAMIEGADVTYKADGKAELRIVNGAVKVTFDPDAVGDGKSYKPSIVFKNNGLTCSIEAQGVSLAASNVTWIPGIFIKNDRAEMKTSFEGSTFQIEQKDMTKAYTTNVDADLIYSIYNEKDSAQAKTLAAMAKADKEVPTIVNGVLSWNDWTALELIIKVEARHNGNLLGSTTFTAYIADPVGAFAMTPKADATLYAGESKNAGSLVDLKASNGKDCFNTDGTLNADLETALHGKVKYAKVGEWDSVITLKADGTVTFNETSYELPADTNIKVKVTYEYQFGKKEYEVTLTLKKGTRPAPAKPAK